MNGPRVLLMTLAERTSAKGNTYLSGWLGKARLIGFKAKEPDKYGNEVWEIYAQEPEPKSDSDQTPRQTRQRHAEQGRARAAGAAVLAAAERDRTPEPPRGWLDDSEAAIADLERGQ